MSRKKIYLKCIYFEKVYKRILICWECVYIVTPWLSVCKRNIPTDRPPLVGEVSANGG
jgi:hypothetical protein